MYYDLQSPNTRPILRERHANEQKTKPDGEFSLWTGCMNWGYLKTTHLPGQVVLLSSART